MFTELLQQSFVHNALIAGALVAITSGLVGVFVVMRRMTFAVHATAELGFTGAAAALVLGLSPLTGQLAGALVVAGVLGLLTVRGQERDGAIGAFLAFGLGVGALLISLYEGSTSRATSLLFGSIVGVDRTQVIALAVLAVVVVAVLVVVARPLLYASVDAVSAQARGVPVKTLSIVLLLLVALTAAQAIQVVGSLLILTLMVLPASSAQFLAKTPFGAAGLSVVFALVATVGGILMSLQWPYPTSFFVSTISFLFYLLARFIAWRRG